MTLDHWIYLAGILGVAFVVSFGVAVTIVSRVIGMRLDEAMRKRLQRKAVKW